MSATGPAARPGLTPIPVIEAGEARLIDSNSRWIVVVLGGHGGDRLQRLDGTLALSLQDDQVAIPSAQCQDPEHASRINRRPFSLAHRDRHRLRRRRFNE
jgi:hypothetical protein